MQFNLLGFTIKRKEEESSVTTFVPPAITDDLGVANMMGGVPSFYGYNAALDSSISATEVSENSLITQYRDIAKYPEVDKAIEEIVSEAIIVDENDDSVKIDLSNTNLSEATKDKVRTSFKKILRLLDFKSKGFDIFRRWYVDSRINYHIIIDEKNFSRGIVELRFIDPKKIKKIRKVVKTESDKIGTKYIEYYKYNEQGIDSKESNTTSIDIAADSIAHANSGLTNTHNTAIIGYLDKAIAPANKLRTLEHSMVISRLVRAPERRLIYVDTGNLPRARAEQYMQSIVAKYKTKITYDTITGKVRDDRNIMALTEDYFIPRQNGSKSTEFSTLKSDAGNTNSVDEIEYLKKQLLEALNVPVTRLDSGAVFNIGRSGEISREEARFSKFIQRLRVKFNDLFDALLCRELVLTNVMSIEDWESVKKDVHYDYLKDNYFTELLESDALANRLGVLAQIEPYIGRFYSDEYVRKVILKQTDEEIKEIDAQIEKERNSDLDAHVPSETRHQVDLQTKLSTIPQQEVSDTASQPNPFKE